ncbi:MAG: type I restriction enzyme HsdR N-terminal domain-containing protein [Nitrospirae bacterium]|jgi:hypothetical protein|nr:type I restriction enzyme HsdR N-terminal domain-containing protein [Nitrospirota bacterium]
MNKEEREKLILEKIKEEEMLEHIKIEGAKELTWDVLINDKLYKPEEIKIDPSFNIKMKDCEAVLTLDYLIVINSCYFLIIKCSPSIESWERYIKAVARISTDYQIPYAMVTNGFNAKIIDIISDKIIGNNINELFNRKEAIEYANNFNKIPFPADKSEREKRIAYAFEGIKCKI